MSISSRVSVTEKLRQIVFENGERLDLYNVTSFDPSGTTLRIWSDEGMTILNPDKINYHLIKKDLRGDDQ